jgi:leucyl-tRNA synthetase
MMFLGPYQEGGDFQDKSISGPRRFLDRLWSVVNASAGAPANAGAEWADARRKMHQTIREVTRDMGELQYNTAISELMKYLNALRVSGEAETGQERAVPKELLEPMLILLAPLAPHFAEEAWERLGHAESIFDTRWPAFDESLAREDQIELVIQINGKVRARMVAPRGLNQQQALERALADPAVRKFVNGGPKKVVYVQDRLLNIVV